MKSSKTLQRHINGIVDHDLVNANISSDKGSIYRYNHTIYGDEASRFYLQQIEENIQENIFPHFLPFRYKIINVHHVCICIVSTKIAL